jgi:hypothetical protein
VVGFQCERSVYEDIRMAKHFVTARQNIKPFFEIFNGGSVLSGSPYFLKKSS